MSNPLFEDIKSKLTELNKSVTEKLAEHKKQTDELQAQITESGQQNSKFKQEITELTDAQSATSSQQQLKMKELESNIESLKNHLNIIVKKVLGDVDECPGTKCDQVESQIGEKETEINNLIQQISDSLGATSK